MIIAMYQMPHFTEKNSAVVIAFMKAHPFVTLIGFDGMKSVATQVPVLLNEVEGKVHLRGHMMRKTDHHLAFEKDPQALILFNGPNCYVSASWYTERGHGSTWNYMTVHARGKMEFKDADFTVNLLKELTHKYEDVQQRPELLENMDQDHYVAPMVKAIVGFEIELESIIPIFKLSQNQNAESHKNIVAHLEQNEDACSKQIALEMKNRR